MRVGGIDPDLPLVLISGRDNVYLDTTYPEKDFFLHQNDDNQASSCRNMDIRTFEPATRGTLDLSAVPVLKELTHLPVIVDPSHAAGRRELVPALARAALAAGADGLIVEIHPAPERAVSDGRQSLTLPGFEAMMADLRRLATALDRTLAGPSPAAGDALPT